jgi:putative ABC transport system permease protein
MDTFKAIWRDLVHAGRSLAKARAFTFVCVASLGIGMAPVIAVPCWFRVFTTPPSAVNTDGLVELVTTRVGPRGATDKWSYPDFLDLHDADTGVSMTGWATGAIGAALQGSDDARTAVPAMFVSSNYFSTIGVALAQGPGFQVTTDPAVVLGFQFWQRRLGADPDIIGKPLSLGAIPHVVVGIAPYAFGGHLGAQDAEIFVPLERHPRLLAHNGARFDRSTEWVRIHGRLSPGVGTAQASAAVSAITSHLARQYPSTNESKVGAVEAYDPIGALEGADATIILAGWQAMTVLPLLVVCLNLSAMVQVRSAMRERELAIRQAIGATRGRLIQHLLAEAVLLAAVGGSLASLVLFNILPVASWWLDEPIPASMQEVLRVDLSMIAICVGICLATSLVFGWLPAVRFSRPLISTILKDDAAGGVRVGRVHRLTAALQVAIAVPLLVLSGMFLDRLRATATADLGFDADLVYAAPLRLDASMLENPEFRIRSVRDNLARASGVASVTVADGLPLDFRYRMVRVSRQTDANVASESVSVHVTRVGDGYLNTMGIPLLRGRSFTADDRAGAVMVAIVSKALADQLFPDADPSEAIGKRLMSRTGEKTQRALTIVGVTADFPTSQMTTEQAQLLLPLAQHPEVRRDSVRVSDDRAGTPALTLVARSAAGEQPAKLLTAMENAVRELDPNFESAHVATGLSLRQNSMADFLNQSVFSGLVGGVILLLAALGIYGVVGLMVATRTREIAVRVALGASRRRVLGMILFDVVKLVMPGVAVGLVITLAIARLNMGVSVSSLEPLAYVAGAAIAILVAVAASLVPARRAASVQPMVAMRSE